MDVPPLENTWLVGNILVGDLLGMFWKFFTVTYTLPTLLQLATISYNEVLHA